MEGQKYQATKCAMYVMDKWEETKSTYKFKKWDHQNHSPGKY